jgi:hypothetical protein
VWIPTTSPDQLGTELANWFGADASTLGAVFPRGSYFDRMVGWA